MAVGLVGVVIVVTASSEIVTVSVIVDPSIVNLVKKPGSVAAEHTEPVSIVHE
jgi:hypothetical protein